MIGLSGSPARGVRLRAVPDGVSDRTRRLTEPCAKTLVETQPRDLGADVAEGREQSVTTKGLTMQFRVALKGIEPEVWRRIVVPAEYSFWDLHVAIQDAMGWLDYHLHAFLVRNPDTGQVDQIGIPEGPFEYDDEYLPGWEVPIERYFREPQDRADYEYDFGDEWQHEIVLEKIASRVPGKKYPMCLDGARACPPEDCGGVHGYQEMLTALRDPLHEQHEDFLEWVGGQYEPDAFSAKKVRFDDPGKRWRNAFDSDEPVM